MTDLGVINLVYDIDRGVIATIDTATESKYDGLEGEGENLVEALKQLIANLEDVSS